MLSPQREQPDAETPAAIAAAIAALEKQRAVLGDALTDAAIARWRQKQAETLAGVEPAQEPTAGPTSASTRDAPRPLGRYLDHVIRHNRYLRLQGIRSGGRLVHIDLERIYITLRTTQQRTVEVEEEWLAAQSAFAPGESQRQQTNGDMVETVVVSVNEALAQHRRLVVLGDPGSGKTTLLRYLALVYARDLAYGDGSVQTKLELTETHLPIYVPLRQLAAFLRVRYPQDDGVEGHGRLLTFLYQRLESDHVLTSATVPDTGEPDGLNQFRQKLIDHFDMAELQDLCFEVGVDDENLKGQTKKSKARELIKHMRRYGRLPQLVKIAQEARPHIEWPAIPATLLQEAPADFFDVYLRQGRATILLDGLDEVSNPALRRRIARLIESFTRAYPQCRTVVTSRIVGYTGAARLGEAFVTTTVRDFTLDDVRQFLAYWHQLIALADLGSPEQAIQQANRQTNQLMQTIEKNERIRVLAINPLLLTVLVLVYRDRVKLPDRRAELYAEAVDVLLGKWDEARGVPERAVLAGKPFDTGDKRLMLQSVALHMHEQEQKEIDVGELQNLLVKLFSDIIRDDDRAVRRAVTRFLQVITERSGLLVERGEGVFAFSHLTFQEYLAALAIAGRDEYVAYTLSKTAATWWREVILLEVGYLSTQSKERTTRLIQAIADLRGRPDPYHNLVLAAHCLRDAGSSRVLGDIEAVIQGRLRADIEIIIDTEEDAAVKAMIDRKEVATQAFIESGGGYWTDPYGEPEWVSVPVGEFIMGSDQGYDDEKPPRRVTVAAFQIGRVPITNAQYALFVQAAGYHPPDYWEADSPPKMKEGHPVVSISWHDAMAYCAWLSQVTGKPIRLPTEAEWEKAARGSKDDRPYPWGYQFDRLRCNSRELKVGNTTPVGIFINGASVYGALGMSGNVWEWTDSWYEADPEQYRVVRGGSWHVEQYSVRVSVRNHSPPHLANGRLGFRVATRSL